MPHALIIDDKQLNVDVLQMLLHAEGVTYSSVRSPSQINSVVASLTQVDVVFLDLEFPDDDGFNILARLREHTNLRGVPIVAYSVHTSEIDATRVAGFDGFLGKPLNIQRFPEQLQRILNRIPVWEV
jgi:two-component system, cell cycle response regulator DivK